MKLNQVIMKKQCHPIGNSRPIKVFRFPLDNSANWKKKLTDEADRLKVDRYSKTRKLIPYLSSPNTHPLGSFPVPVQPFLMVFEGHSITSGLCKTLFQGNIAKGVNKARILPSIGVHLVGLIIL